MGGQKHRTPRNSQPVPSPQTHHLQRPYQWLEAGAYSKISFVYYIYSMSVAPEVNICTALQTQKIKYQVRCQKCRRMVSQFHSRTYMYHSCLTVKIDRYQQCVVRCPGV